MTEKKRMSRALPVFTGIVMVAYGLWRLLYTIPGPREYGPLAFVGGIFLLVAEVMSSYEALTHYISFMDYDEPEPPVIPEDMYPDVDVFISTHNEDTDILFKTASACAMMKYPDRSKVHVYLCDDTARAEVEQLAKELGVGYFGLKNNQHAKAGNINNALSKTKSPLIATFDADMIPKSSFLMEVVPYFFLPVMKKNSDGKWEKKSEEELDGSRIGFIQTPQSFYNPDLFQYNLYAEDKVPNEQDYFFRQVNIAKNKSNAVLYAGSNTMISREALEGVGGIATGTITEDFETGLRIEADGYTCYATSKQLAHGLAPITIKSLLKQRIRWARGCIYSLRKVHLLTNKKFNLKLKLSYYACRIYWESFTRRLVYILSPALFLLLGIPLVIFNLRQLLFIWLPYYMIYTFLLSHISGDIRNTRWSNTIDTIMFPYLLIPVWLEIFHINEKKFSVTAKSRTFGTDREMYLAIPHICLLGISGLSLIYALRELVMHKAFGLVIMVMWLLLNSLSLLMAVLFMMGRVNYRMHERFKADFPVTFRTDHTAHAGRITDISEGGFALTLAEDIALEELSDTVFLLTDREYRAEVTGQAVAKERIKKSESFVYRIQKKEFTDIDTKRQYLQMVYDRDISLPSVLQNSTGYFDDLFHIVERRNAENS